MAPALTGGPRLVEREHQDQADNIAGEEAPLVRPYMMTTEERAHHRWMTASQRLSVDPWRIPMEVH
ncbi:hypothetical protein [Streptomyces sp. NPDC058739]|uniref:hypothetical protein n=1 Tax=Streptomyces sp. NPDC058739 TaxID=3346618 RepID=UPI0036AA4C5C